MSTESEEEVRSAAKALANVLANEPRMGAVLDSPEGARYIELPARIFTRILDLLPMEEMRTESVQQHSNDCVRLSASFARMSEFRLRRLAHVGRAAAAQMPDVVESPVFLGQRKRVRTAMLAYLDGQGTDNIPNRDRAAEQEELLAVLLECSLLWATLKGRV